MPLIKIPNQPLFSDPNRPTEEGCGVDYCHPVRADDTVYTQFYQTPCGTNEACDGDFNDITWNAFLDQDFSVCPPAGWTLGGGWGCSGGGIKGDAGGASAGTSTATVVPGTTQYNTYKITFTISSPTQGWVEVILGNLVNGVSTGRLTADGTYTYILVYDDPVFVDQLTIACSGTSDALGQFDGIIDDIDIDEATLNCWTNNTGTWLLDGSNGACKTNTTLSGTLVENTANYISANETHKIVVELTDYISGSLTLTAGGGSGNVTPSFSGNGTHTFYLTPTLTGVMTFTPTADFVGCIDSVDIREIRTDYTITVIDADTLAEIDDISSFIEYEEDWVTLIFKPSDINRFSGCFRLYAFDECDVMHDDIAPNGAFIGGTTTIPPNDWRRNNGGSQYDFSGDQVQFIHSGVFPGPEATYPLLLSVQIPLLEAGNYEISFEIISNTDTTNIGIGAQLDGILPSPLVTHTTVGTHTITINGYDPATNGLQEIWLYGNFDVTGSGTPTGGNVVVDNLTLNRIAPFSATYTSECFKIGTSFPKTKLFTGYSDNDAFGFEYTNTGFRLSQRLECRSLSPSWPITKDSYTYSTGDKSNHYSEVSKDWELFIEAAPESSHGTMALQISSDHFIIGDSESDTTEYVTEDGDYSPEWERSGAADIAPSRVTVRVKEEGTLFKRKC